MSNKMALDALTKLVEFDNIDRQIGATRYAKGSPLDKAWRDARAAIAALQAEPQGWKPISEAPKGELIDIWIPHADGGGVRWTGCYYDNICDEWRTIDPSGHLVSVKARVVSHFHAIPTPPKD